MEQEENTTRQRIQQAALQEFLDKGFRDASLRRIVKNAGVTTGALYGYFSGKEALFASIVEPHAAAVMGQFMQAQTDFAELPAGEQPDHVGVESRSCTQWMVDYMYRYPAEFKLLLCRSGGTAYEDFVHHMVDIEVDSTYRFLEVLRSLGRQVPDLEPPLCHMIASSMFNGVFEVIAHDMPYQQAKRYVDQLQGFYLAGWQKMMGW